MIAIEHQGVVTMGFVRAIAMPFAFAWTVVGSVAYDGHEDDVAVLLARATRWPRPFTSPWIAEAAVVARQETTPTLSAEDLKPVVEVFEILLNWDREARGVVLQ